MSDTPDIQEPSPDGGLADHPLTAQRLAKHEATLAGDGYPYRFDRSDYSSDLAERYESLEPGEETEDRVPSSWSRRLPKLAFLMIELIVFGFIEFFFTLNDEP